jgi:alpha-tubulin suppressor-like RCC1 family protein
MIRTLVVAAAALALVPTAAPAQVVYAWGSNAYGQLGNGSNTDSNVPVAVSTAGVLNGQKVTVVSAGGYQGMAVANGHVYAWGYNIRGELGNGSNSNINVPVAVSTAGVLNGVMVTSFAGGYDHSLALANGQVFAWGYNADGELGNGTNSNSNVPVAVSTSGVLGGNTVTAVAAGNGDSLALANGQVYAWGNNDHGQLGNGSTISRNSPVAVSASGVLGGKTVTALAAGDIHSLAVAGGQAYAWGSNSNGQLGNGSNTNSNVPVAVSTAGVLNGLTVTAVAGGGAHSLALANGQVFAWGYNGDGELGNGTKTDSKLPVAVNSLVLSSLQATEIAAGNESSYALTSTGRLFAWGDNTRSQLGIGSTAGNFTTPQEVLAPSGYLWTSISSDADEFQVMAIATPVPEPGTMGLIVAAGLGAFAVRRRNGLPANLRCAGPRP